MITLLETLVEGADGAYATKQDLRNLEHAMFAWADRKEAYLAIQSNEKSIIDRAMASIQLSKGDSAEISWAERLQFVLESICVELPKEQANLFKPYFKLAQDMIMSEKN